MPKILFTDDFDFWPSERNGNVSVAYKKGMTRTVTAECAEKAIAAGKGKQQRLPRARKQGREADGAEE